jgi:hypothetical protein
VRPGVAAIADVVLSQVLDIGDFLAGSVVPVLQPDAGPIRKVDIALTKSRIGCFAAPAVDMKSVARNQYNHY